MGEVLRLERMNLESRDVVEDGRPFFIMNSCEESRNRLSYLADMSLDGAADFGKCMEEMRQLGVSFFDSNKNYPGYEGYYYDCRDWAFDRVGLPDYTYRDGGCVADGLVGEDFRNIFRVSEPRGGNLAMYHGCNVAHWGVVESVGDRINVLSKWGRGHVYSHFLEAVSIDYGDRVMFFDKKD